MIRDSTATPAVPAPADPIVTTVASILALKALAGTDITGTVEVLSRIASDIPDGLGGLYTWNATDTRSDNSSTLCTIIQPDSGGVGRWNPATVPSTGLTLPTLTATTSVVTPLVGTVTNTVFNIQVDGISRWIVDNTGGSFDLLPNFTDNTQSIGRVGFRVKQIFTPIIDSGTAGSLSLKTHDVDTTPRTQCEILHTASADRRITVTGSNGANPTIGVTAGSLAITPNVVGAGSFTSGAPAGGTAGAWKFGVAATVSPTAPDRTIELDIGGTIYYLHAKTTNN